MSKLYPECIGIVLLSNNNCNMGCSYCYASHKNSHYMSIQTALDAIDLSYNELELPTRFKVNFIGGEPLLNYEMIKACFKHAQERGYKIQFGIVTNMTLLTDDIIKDLKDNNVVINVSYDGNKEAQNEYRCNTYDLVIEKTKKLMAEIPSEFILGRPTIMPKYAKNMYDSVLELYNLGMNQIANIPCTSVDWSAQELEDYKENYIKIFKWYLEKNKDGRHVWISQIDDIIQPDPIGVTNKMCSLGNRKYLVVNHDGSLLPCHQWEVKNNNTIPLGTIYDPLPPMRELKHKKYDECIKCEASLYCAGGCPSENLEFTADMETACLNYCAVRKKAAEALKEVRELIINGEFNNPMLNELKETFIIDKEFDELAKAPLSELSMKLESFSKKINKINNLYIAKYIYKLLPLYMLLGGGKNS